VGEAAMERLPSLAETKFQDVLLAFAVAQLFPGVKSNSLAQLSQLEGKGEQNQ
jgi:hypothetical protein